MAMTEKEFKVMAIGGGILGGLGYLASCLRCATLGAHMRYGTKEPLIAPSFSDETSVGLAFGAFFATAALGLGSIVVYQNMKKTNKGEKITTSPTASSLLAVSCFLFAIIAEHLFRHLDDEVGRTVVGSLMVFSGVYAGAMALGPTMVNKLRN